MARDSARRGVLRVVGGGSGQDEFWRRVEAAVAARGEPPEVCGLCFGTGWEVVEGRGGRRCGCKREEDRQRLVESAKIPERYRGCTLSNFAPVKGNDAHLRALGYAHRLVEDYPRVEAGLLLVGPCGVGKSHLAVAVLNGLLAKGVRCMFYEFGALLKQIQDSYNQVSRTTEMRVLAPVYDVEVLLLDELGGRCPTDWVRDTMMQIINTRYNEKRLTLFTSNYVDPPDVAGTGGGRERSVPAVETLEDRIGYRLRSRLYEMCCKVEMGGEDYRRRSGG